MPKICRHGFVSGKVQGVFYRQQTKQQAQRLQLSGWVQNLPDGRVEFLVCGEEAQVNELLAWLPNGPARAQVTDVQISEAALIDDTRFEIRG